MCCCKTKTKKTRKADQRHRKQKKRKRKHKRRTPDTQENNRYPAANRMTPHLTRKKLQHTRLLFFAAVCRQQAQADKHTDTQTQTHTKTKTMHLKGTKCKPKHPPNRTTDTIYIPAQPPRHPRTLALGGGGAYPRYSRFLRAIGRHDRARVGPPEENHRSHYRPNLRGRPCPFPYHCPCASSQ